MKKSSFLRNSKDMLTKSFNSAKCKTSLKLASSRLKLLRNKKEVQVKQMKRELAQLLDSGQDRTARIRVEHVIREEKMMAAYDLIEIYCELIVARLPIIESQKNCPIDLKEAITSVVFASPRCGDIPELVDVRKHLTAKYGKEFFSAAVELRPDCGVSRMLVEKLSAKAPDTQTKIKILGAIAEEHGVKWDPKSVEEAEAVPPNDLLNGPSTLKKANYIHEDPPNFEASPNASSISPEELARSQNSVSAHGDGRGMASSSYHHLGGSPSGFRDERSGVGQSFSGGQNWNMEFKDATSAAQAAAESAERASLAARAAAQLSRQHSSESQRSQVLSSGGGGPRMYGTSSPHEHFPKDSSTSDSRPRPHDDTIRVSRHDNLSKVKNQFHDDSHATSAGRGPGNHGISSTHEQYPKDSATSSSPDRNSRFQNKWADDLPHDHLASATRHRNDSHSTSDKPQSQVSSGSINNSFAKPEDGDRYMQNSLSKEKSRKMMNPSGRSEAESMSSSEDESTENLNYFGEATTTKEPKFNSTDSAFGESIPHSNHQSFGIGSANDPFNGGKKGDIPSETVKKNVHDSGSVAFDDSGSEDYDIIKFDSDPAYDDQQAKLYFPSPDRKSPTHNSAIKNSWSFDSDKSQEKSAVSLNTPQLSESLTVSSDKLRPENVVPTFDDSESDSERVHPPNGRSKVFHTVFDEHAWNGDGNEWSHSVSDRLVSSDVPRHDKSESINSSSEDEAKHTKSREGKDNMFHGAQTNISSLPSSDSGFEKELEFGKLSGGLKHRGHIPPPYTRSQLNNVSSSVERAKENPVAKSQAVTPPKTSIGFGMKTDGNKSSSRSHFASDTDTSDEELLRETASYAQKTGSEVDTKYAGLRGSNTYFDSDSSDSEAGPKKQSPTVRSQFSRRTKASSSSAHAKSPSRAAVNSNSGVDRRNTSMAETQEPQKPLRDSFFADAQEAQRFVRKSYTSESNKTPSDRRVSSEQSGSSSAASKPTSLEESGKSARAEQPSSSVQKAPTSSAAKFSREDSLKKASHVHPKLPDYDDIAARLQSLRTNSK